MRITTLADETSAVYDPKPKPPYCQRREPFYFVVMGKGFFPSDMLRYDQAWAVTGVNVGGERAYDMVSDAQEWRCVVVASWRHELSKGRWNSFGWEIVEEQIGRPSFLPPA